MSEQKTIIEPKQARSKQTQQKLLDALHSCLEEKFFEHISIQELAQKANVSVGSYYRRFKNKESLLPMLYENFSQELIAWIDTFEAKSFDNLHQSLEQLIDETKGFLLSRKSIFRTLHLNSRLYPEFISVDNLANRRSEYQRLADILLRYENEMTASNPLSATNLVIHTTVNGLMDKILYPDLTPAIASELALEEYAQALLEMQYRYLAR